MSHIGQDRKLYFYLSLGLAKFGGVCLRAYTCECVCMVSACTGTYGCVAVDMAGCM